MKIATISAATIAVTAVIALIILGLANDRKMAEQIRMSNEREMVFRSKYMGVPFQMNGVTYTATIAPNWGRTYTCVSASGSEVELERDVLIKLVDSSH